MRGVEVAGPRDTSSCLSFEIHSRNADVYLLIFSVFRCKQILGYIFFKQLLMQAGGYDQVCFLCQLKI